MSLPRGRRRRTPRTKTRTGSDFALLPRGEHETGVVGEHDRRPLSVSEASEETPCAFTGDTASAMSSTGELSDLWSTAMAFSRVRRALSLPINSTERPWVYIIRNERRDPRAGSKESGSRHNRRNTSWTMSSAASTPRKRCASRWTSGRVCRRSRPRKRSETSATLATSWGSVSKR